MKAKRSTIATAVVLVVLMTLPFVPVSGASTNMEAPAEAQSKFLAAQGTWIVDGQSNQILLRGVNFKGYEAAGPTSWATAHSQTDYRNFKSWGFNVVRILISWSKIEPKFGYYDSSYLTYVDRDVAWAKESGIYIVLDMHTWRWPSWMTTTYGGDANYPSLVDSESFWQNATLRAHFIRAWQFVAQHYANEPTIAGYDLFNEPWQYFNYTKHTVSDAWIAMKTLYEQSTDGIRRIENNHTVFVEIDDGFFDLAVSDPFQRPNIVWEYHDYAWTYDYYGHPYIHSNINFLENAIARSYNTVVVKLRQPLWIGEFGMEMKVNGSDTWTQDQVALFNKYNLGWAWWVYWRTTDPDNGMCLLNSDGTQRMYFLQFLMNPLLKS